MDQLVNQDVRKFKSSYHKKKWEEAEGRRKQVKAMRETGATWPQIGLLFNVTPQRAMQLGKP